MTVLRDRLPRQPRKQIDGLLHQSAVFRTCCILDLNTRSFPRWSSHRRWNRYLRVHQSSQMGHQRVPLYRENCKPNLCETASSCVGNRAREKLLGERFKGRARVPRHPIECRRSSRRLTGWLCLRPRKQGRDGYKSNEGHTHKEAEMDGSLTMHTVSKVSWRVRYLLDTHMMVMRPLPAAQPWSTPISQLPHCCFTPSQARISVC